MGMEITERLFVSTGSKLQQGNKILGMARKCTGKSPDKKAIESIRKWVGGKADENWVPDILDNEPTFGHEIVDYVSRYRTDNKWFEIVDPRGFKLQVSCENLLDLIREETIRNGVIQSECVWGFYNTPHLMGINSEAYRKAMAVKSKKESKKRITGSKLVVGEVYDKSDSDHSQPLVYLGRASAKSITTDNSSNYGYGNRTKEPDVEMEVHDCFLFATIYADKLQDKDYKPNSYGPSLNLTKTCPKVYETSLTTIHSTQTIRDWITQSTSKSYHSVPGCLKPPKSGRWRRNFKLVYIKAPGIDLEQTF